MSVYFGPTQKPVTESTPNVPAISDQRSAISDQRSAISDQRNTAAISGYLISPVPFYFRVRSYMENLLALLQFNIATAILNSNVNDLGLFSLLVKGRHQ